MGKRRTKAVENDRHINDRHIVEKKLDKNQSSCILSGLLSESTL